MRRKSKKTKEETTTSTERRSKRSSARRKRAYEDDEVGSDVEEEKVVEEEMTPAKTRGGRRYATRGRRQKAEESEEEEVSQVEEEQEEEEDENSNNVAIATESASRENEVTEEYKSLKSGIAVSDKSIVSEGGDGASAWKSDKHTWGMKSNKDSQDDRGEETPAQGEGDDGEEEGSRSHTRKRKLKLSRECLQESREAIPKIRLRLSRNRSGGYETEKLEAERIETKKSEESLVKVIKVKTIFEGKEPLEKEEEISKDIKEAVVSTEKPEESPEQPAEATEGQPEEVASEEQAEEVASEGHSEEVASEEQPEEVASEEQAEEVASEEQAEEVAGEEQPEEVGSEEQPEEVASEEQSEEVASEEQSEEVASEEQSEEVASEEQSEEVASEEQPEEEPEVQKEESEEDTCKENIEEGSAKESEEEDKAEIADTEQVESEEVCGERGEESESQAESPEVKEAEVEEEGKQEVEEEIEQEKEEEESRQESEESGGQEVVEEREVEEEGSPEVEKEGREVEEVREQEIKEVESRQEEEEEAKVAEKGEEEEQEEDKQESSKEASPSIPEGVEEKLDEAGSMEEKEQKSEPEVDENVEAESSSTSPAAKEKEEVEEKSEEQEAESERQEAPDDQSDEGKEEEPQEKQVSVAGEVSDQPIVEEDKEVEESKESDSEKQKDDERESSEAEEEKDRLEEKKDTEEVEDKLVKTEEVKIVADDVQGDKAADCDEGKERNAVFTEVVVEFTTTPTKEKEPRHESSERISRISRPKLKHDDGDDVTEELQNQKRRRRRRSRSGESNSEQRRLSTSETAQPKRVTLKRPRLIRNISSSSIKETTIEEKPPVEEPVESKVEEEKEETPEIVTPVEESTPQPESKPVEEGSNTEEGMRKRRRKWGQQKSQSGPSQSKRAFISISTQSLKGLIPEVKPLPIHELRLSVEKDEAKDICIEEEESCEVSMDETIVRMIDTNGQNERTVWAQVVEEERTSVHAEVARVPVVGSDGPASTVPVRRISIVSDDATRLQRSPSPPRHPPSNVLFLSNLVRPFTVQQLKELLARTGTVTEDGFWIDRIKSMCLVQYESEDQARETRHALHGVRWPISNPKRLFVDFSTKERLEEAKREGNVPAPVPPTVAAPSLSPTHTAPRDDFPRKTEPLRVDGSGMVPVHHPIHRVTPGSPTRQAHALIRQPGAMMPGGPEAEAVSTDSVAWQQRNRPRPDAPVRPGANSRDYKLSAPVREWDLDKVVQQSPPGAGMHGPNRGPVDERRRPEAAGQPSGRRDRMLPSPPPSMQEIQARKAKRKEAEAAAAAAAEAPANLLDSLFRKTKATPSIYWLPLTADQIKVKEEIRRQHLAEHERRIAEMKRAAEKDRGSRRRRRSSTPRRRSRRRSGEGSSAAHKKSSESMKGHKTSSASPKK